MVRESNKTILTILSILGFAMVLWGCTVGGPNVSELEDEIKEKDAIITQLEEEKKALENKINSLESKITIRDSDNILFEAMEVIELIKDRDMSSLSKYVHPTKGLRFTPYPYVDAEKDLVFTAQQISSLVTDTKQYVWGNYDGSGEPIQLSFEDYYSMFIYDVDFANPDMIGNNVVIGKGNAIDNVKEAYPNGYFVEFYFKGFEPEYEGIDWRSLKLVFEEENRKMYLVGIIHGQWTI